MTDKPYIPEKIYIPTKLNGALYGNRYFEEPIGGVEYIRTDAFVEKATNFLYDQLNNGTMEVGNIEKFVEDFRKAMEE